MPAVGERSGQPRLRILLVTTGLKLGGAEQQVAALARAFRELGNEVAILSLTSGRDVEFPQDIAITELRMRKTPLSMLLALRKARQIVLRWQPDVIHAHMVHANLFARILTRLGRTPPLVCSAHSAREGGRLRAMAYRMTDRWCTLTTHVSDAGRAAMIASGAVPARRVSVVPNGIDTSRFRPDNASRERTRRGLGLSPTDVLLLNVGRLVPEKDHGMLIEAFHNVASLMPRTRLMIAGDGPLRSELVAKIALHELNDSVLLAGTRSDIPDLLRAADVFVLSSRIEGMPLAVGEALASGLPVVATAAAGVSELAGGTATLTPVGDVHALAHALRDAIARLPSSQVERDRRRQQIVSRFDMTTVARQWLAQYQALKEKH